MMPVEGHLISWFLGGVILLTTLLMRTERRPHALSFALIGYGGAGIVACGLGEAATLPSIVAASIAGAIGYLLQPRRSRAL